jgi:hypothetical protein
MALMSSPDPIPVDVMSALAPPVVDALLGAIDELMGS